MEDVKVLVVIIDFSEEEVGTQWFYGELGAEQADKFVENAAIELPRCKILAFRDDGDNPFGGCLLLSDKHVVVGNKVLTFEDEDETHSPKS